MLYEREGRRQLGGDYPSGLAMIICVAATWFFITPRRPVALYAGDVQAQCFGINMRDAVHAFGWLGIAGIGGLIQAHYAQEVVPNALYGRELDVLAAVVLGGARLGGGKGSVLGCVLGVLLISITQNGLNLAGVSPFAFKMIIGAIILVAITLSNSSVEKLLPFMRQEGGRK